MPFPNEHAARLRKPGDFSPTTFRRTKGSGKGKIQGAIVPATISVIWGKLKDKDGADDPPIAQALRFPIKNWTEKQARGWLKNNKVKFILFEPAKKKEVKKEKDMDSQKVEVKKFFSELADGKDPLAKQDPKAVLINKTACIEPAENGVILRISEEWEIPATKDKRRDWRWIEKRYIGEKYEDLLPIIQKEMKVQKGSKIALADLDTRSSTTDKVEVAKRVGVFKRNLSFATGEMGGHLHLANGAIEDRVEGKEIVKYFVGETMPDKLYFSMDGDMKDFTSKMLNDVNETFETHVHKFAIKIDKDDDSHNRAIGSTGKHEEHWHSVNIMDFVSTPATNSPDMK